jgi:ribosomal-protein-alanine N-acetyltransferase
VNIQLPPWPASAPTCGSVVLREFSARDIPMIQELASDPYVPLIGSLPAHATYQQAQDWVDRQNGRLAEGTGYSFAITEADTDCDPGRGFAADALLALTAFAWSIPGLHRIELYIEPWNTGSVKTAGRAGYEREGLLRSHPEIGGRRRDMLLYAVIRESQPG